jgi:hypothetical protein
MWTPARASTPRASIVHRFAPSSPAGHVNGPTSSSVARPHCSPTLRPTRKCDQRCTRPIDAIHTPTSSTCDFVRLPSASSLRPCGRCLVRFTSLHALQRSARAPCRRFSLPHRGVTSKIVFERLTSDTPVASLVGSPRSRDGGLQLGRDRFPRSPREEKTAMTNRGVFHRDDAGRPATSPFRATPVLREDECAVSPPRFAFRRHFARRGLPLWASPRSFELVPVKESELARLWARRRRSTSATRHEVQTHRAIASCLARVLAEARHALLGRPRRLRQEQCSRGCERRHQSLSRLGPCGIALAGERRPRAPSPRIVSPTEG